MTAAFSPSPQFAKRWLATPAVVKRTFHQELDDIIEMLRSESLAQDFEFNHPDFGQTLDDLFFIHKDENKTPAKLIYNLDNAQTFVGDTQPQSLSFTNQELSAIEHQITQKLSTQIDDFLGEHLVQLSDDLKAWLKTAVKNELSAYHSQQ